VPRNSSYPNAVYYCSQEAATAFCARSDDGGATFGPGIPIYDLLQCTGIHGHVKVAPDGTVYVPNRSCGGKAAVIVSRDNGVNWTVAPNPNSGTTGFLVDPSVGIGATTVGKSANQASNTIYLGYQAADGHPRIAVSHDQGAHWENDQDVGTLLGIVNSTFPEVVAGDDNRAAYAFLGTTVAGNYTSQTAYDQSAPWHLYIATTFDGGATWTTIDATPTDPVQRGSICNLGTTSCNGHSPNDRNLLDFMDATVDAQGRVLVAYPDGCIGSCIDRPSGAHPNSYTARASIARQSGGRRLFASFDPTEPNLPKAPRAVATFGNNSGPIKLSWPAADDGGAAISGYKIYRKDASGNFNLLGSVSATNFSDSTFTGPTTSQAYRVTAVNSFGEGPNAGDIVPFFRAEETACTAPFIQVAGEGSQGNVPADPTSGQLTIQRLNIGEPMTVCNDNSITFVMKVQSLDPQNIGTVVLPENSEWQVLFGVNDTNGNAQKVFVSLDTFPPNSQVTPRLAIGRRDPTATGTLDSRVCTSDATNTCPAISATYDKDGTITFKLDVSHPINFSAPGSTATGTAFTWDGSAVGTQLGVAQVISGTTYLLVGAGAGLLETVQATSGADYTRVGNMACASGVPTASLSANPTTGAPPLTVNFDASASSAATSCSTIASYRLDFGDGNIAEQPTATFTHTYNNAGDYLAHLSVTDSAGHSNANNAEVVIHVTSANPTPTPTPTPATAEGTQVIQGTYDPHKYPCGSDKLTFNVGPGKSSIVVQANATVPANDISVSLIYNHDGTSELIKTEDTGTCCEALRYAPAGQVPPGEYQVQICQTPNTSGVPQNAPFTYTGTFTVTDGGSAPSPTPAGSPTPTPTPRFIPPAPQDNGPKVGFENFTAPGVLLTTLVTSAGQQPNSVEYQGRNAGEPSIGNNWKTGVTAFQTDLQTLFVTFDDSCPTNGQSSTWVNRQAPTSQAVNSDPIGFTDRQTGRTFAGELTLLSPSCKTSFTDDDGLHWTPTQGSGIASGVDHQTIGGGPFAAPLTRPTDVPGLYPNAVYYCSQDTQDDTGFCSRSDDGGLTFGPSVPISTPAVSGCSGLHGHVKVSPKDGAVYLPVNQCNGVGSVLVSLDNGVTWTVRQVQSAGIQTKPSLSFQDPAVAVDASGRVYYVIADSDSAAAVLTSTNHGETWQNLGDVGAPYGLKNVRYPAAIAADEGRASVAFYGTTTPGDALQSSFDGEWHLYIANTFDGGQTWTTTDATPGAPMQRGCIWAKGGASVCRNLLDFFDMTVDRDGRVIVGYVNGCEGGPCAQASHTAKGNAYTAAATIARQSSGRRLVAAKDPLSAMSKPGVPSVTQRRVGDVVHLGWSEADTGNSPITSYKIMRGTSSGGETLLATVGGNVTRYDDTSATDTSKTYYYTVLAVNAAGTSCGTNETAAPYVGDTCNGLIIHRNEPTHPEANLGLNTPASLLIDYVAVAEPPGTNNLMLKMKVNSLASIPQNSRWRVSWDAFAAEDIDPDAQQFYVGMTTGPSGGPTFEWGTLADAGLPAVYAISETKRGDALPGSGYNADGTITIIIPKSAVGNPQPGDLLGAVNGRTFTADVPGTPESKLERSNLFVDHTFVKAQTDNSYPASTYMIAGNIGCSQFIEQNVNSMVTLQPSGAATVGTVSSFNMVIKNSSTQTIFAPLRIEVASISSASGRVTVANADNGRTGAGAAWDYSTFIGADNALTANESSALRSLKFNNPNKEAFTVTFNVIGNLARSSQSSSAGGGSSGGDPTGAVTNLVYSVTYSPLLNTLKSQLIKP
jgi:PKD repeat protein